MAENSGHRKPRKCSDANGGYPYVDERVPFILIVGDRPIGVEGDGMNWAFRADEKLALIALAEQNEDYTILTCWPGKARTDVFVIDELAEASAALEASL